MINKNIIEYQKPCVSRKLSEYLIKMVYEVEPHVPRWIESGKDCIKVEPLWIICDPD